MLTQPPAAAMVAGVPVREPTRASAIGTWWTTGDGSALAMTQRSQDVAAVAAGCRAVRSLRLPGVWPIVDLAAEHGGCWLLTQAPLRPTLDELLDGTAPLEPLALAGIVNEIGQTLLALRQAGWEHAALRAESVVFGADGIARLADAGACAVPRGEETANAAWAALVERVGARRGAGSDAGSDAAFAAVAETARCDGLPAALGRLGILARSLPDGGDRRASVRAAVAAALTAPPAPSSTTTMASARRSAAPRAAATMLGRRQQGQAPVEAASREEIRFGPGVSLPPAAMPAAAAAAAPAHKRRRYPVLALLLVAAAAGVIWWLLHRTGPLVVSSVTMTSVHPPAGCNSSAELRAAVATNGHAGTITYRWLRSDGTSSRVLRAHLSAGQRAEVLSMRWEVDGVGDYHGRATLLMLSPTRARASGAFAYHCG